jgi:hypothetical protein
MDGTTTGQAKSLADYIQGSGYQTVSVDPSFVEEGGEALAEALNPVPDSQVRRLTPEALDGLTVGEDSSSAIGNALDPAGLDGSTGAPTNALTPELQAEQRLLDQRREELDRREAEQVAAETQRLQQQAQAAAQAERQRFLNYYNSLESDEEKQIASMQYQLHIEKQKASYLEQQMQQTQAQTMADRERIAKNQVIFATARQHQIPNEFIPFLNKADNAEELDNMVVQVKQLMKTHKITAGQQAREERVASGVDVAGGANAGFVPPAGPKPRSGDLLGLIRSRPFQVMQAAVEQS